MYGASIVGYKVNQKEERRRVVFHTVPFTAKNIVRVEIPFWIQQYKEKYKDKRVEDIHVVVFEMTDSANPPTLRRRK